jgi:two-component system response regulator HydG
MRVVIADDDPNTRYLLEIYVRGEPYQAEFCPDGTSALKRVRQGDVDAVVTDIRMPGLTGDELLRAVKADRPELPVVLMTEHGTTEQVVEMVRLGADDYISKPFTREQFTHRIRKVVEALEKRRENQRLHKELRELREKGAAPGIIGESQAMRAVLARLPLVAQTDAPVMVLGESGTGKEMAAQAIHAQSRRAKARIVAVNCGALPDTLLESELFGYKRGAFTDAHRDTPGLVESAEGGTLFLDEIGDVSLPVQVKLLRFLQTREYKPLGSTVTIKADVRIITATHRDLPDLIHAGRFREDLYYRLNVVPITLPPLRDRLGDIPLLAAHFLRRYCAEHGKDLEGFTEAALTVMQAQHWPGNVRELENRIHRAVVLCPRKHVDVQDLGLSVPPGGGTDAEPSDGSLSFRDAKNAVLHAFESAYARRVLRDAGGNITTAARMAGLDRKSFFLLLRKHGVDAAALGARVGRPPLPPRADQDG